MNQDSTENPSGTSEEKSGTGQVDAPRSSGILERTRKIYTLLIIVAVVLFIAGGVAVFLVTRPYHLYFLGFIILFSAFEAR